MAPSTINTEMIPLTRNDNKAIRVNLVGVTSVSRRLTFELILTPLRRGTIKSRAFPNLRVSRAISVDSLKRALCRIHHVFMFPSRRGEMFFSLCERVLLVSAEKLQE
jgi:hypothetical protein